MTFTLTSLSSWCEQMASLALFSLSVTACKKKQEARQFPNLLQWPDRWICVCVCVCSILLLFSLFSRLYIFLSLFRSVFLSFFLPERRNGRKGHWRGLFSLPYPERERERESGLAYVLSNVLMEWSYLKRWRLAQTDWGSLARLL